ncbi:MAG: hypothetical protein COV59_00780 [Candidatus Magasanikbacteria bacterium CG11_big_fil_rev_8_21_14_0_20_39_34]|uniref:Isochorismatase-like domain-containing protein n=1 Tax=Candidatus Magasanikbacteria bacterium CG11_big_fil_rev_8_21_14_0_20_39_34 TaxID=1974653 RepID=A0A2H0N6J2_9BACT|nr:MAG: hypothetical protein COV59_00780 [Candidatus Magasanikbacteria bacterium CG11_big_fil_rev_8_21_14_0_20_39_34]
MKKALILVDLENEWITEGSDYFLGDISSLFERTNKLIDFCRKNGYKIIFVTHEEEGSEDAFAPGTTRVNIIDGIDKKEEDIHIRKNKISPFYHTNLEEELNGVEEVVISGILANLCVRSTVQDAYDRDFDITVIKDCCASFDAQTQKFTFKDLHNTREEIQFKNLDEFLSGC